jgi:hypothetical protein
MPGFWASGPHGFPAWQASCRHQVLCLPQLAHRGFFRRDNVVAARTSSPPANERGAPVVLRCTYWAFPLVFIP